MKKKEILIIFVLAILLTYLFYILWCSSVFYKLAPGAHLPPCYTWKSVSLVFSFWFLVLTIGWLGTKIAIKAISKLRQRLSKKSTKTKIFLIILCLIVLAYLLFPKKIGFMETFTLPNGKRGVVGQYYRCFGIRLSQWVNNNRKVFRCIGIPYSKITI